MRVVTVLKTGGEYRQKHVERLRSQVAKWAPDAEFQCLSDTNGTLKHGWPGWWSKMEMFSPDIRGDILYLDLDTSIVGPLDDIFAVRKLTLLRDFYRPDGLGSGMMFLPEECRDEIWRAWIANPTKYMREHKQGGDQAFLERFWLDKADRWQDIAPGQVLSYKVHVRKAVIKGREYGNGTMPESARVVCFHGRPRPWDIGW